MTPAGSIEETPVRSEAGTLVGYGDEMPAVSKEREEGSQFCQGKVVAKKTGLNKINTQF